MSMLKVIISILLLQISVQARAQKETSPWFRTYQTEDAAATAVFNNVAAQSNAYRLSDREVGGWIVQNEDGGYSPTIPVYGPDELGSISRELYGPPPSGVSGIYHTHPAENPTGSVLSPPDRKFANDHGVPIYAREPDGSTHKFIPNSTDEIELEGESIHGWEDPDGDTNKEAHKDLVDSRMLANQIDYVKEQIDNVKEPTGCSVFAVGGACSFTFGDPHIKTLDGYSYSFQAVGEFIALGSDSNDLLIQVRQEPIGSNISNTTAVAALVAGDVIGVYLLENGFELTVNNKLIVNIRSPISLPQGGEVSVVGSRIVIGWPSGDRLTIKDSIVSLNYTVSLQSSRAHRVFGLMGNFDGNALNELTTSEGKILSIPSFTAFNYSDKFREMLYGDFANSWRIGMDKSLFVYANGKSSTDYQDISYPKDKSIALSDKEIEAARVVCENEGIKDADILANCMFDVAMAKDVRYAASAKAADDDTRINRSQDDKPRWGEITFIGELTGESKLIRHNFWANAGEMFFFQVEKIGGNLDLTSAKIVDPGGYGKLSTCINCNQLGAFKANRTGSHQLVLSREEGESGNYKFIANRVPSAKKYILVLDTPLTVKQKNEGAGNIELPGSVDLYQIKLDKGTQVVIRQTHPRSLYFGSISFLDPEAKILFKKKIYPGVSESAPILILKSGIHNIKVTGGESWSAPDILGYGEYDIGVHAF